MTLILFSFIWYLSGVLGIGIYWLKSPRHLKKWGKYSLRFILSVSLLGLFTLILSLFYISDKNEKNRPS
jgi:hypothetical protein